MTALLVAVYACRTVVCQAPGLEVEIRVEAQRPIARVSPLLFGSNFNPKMESDQKIIDFMADTGLRVLRYPGGTGSFDGATGQWARRENGQIGFGPRPEPLADFDAFMAFCRKLGAEALVEVNVGTGSPEKAAQFVRRVNVEQGHKVRYWDLGNEVWLPPEGSGDFKHYEDPREYARAIAEYARAMKAADPDIKLGMGSGGSYYDDKSDWDRRVLAGAAEHIDYISLHWYPNHTNQTHADGQGRSHPAAEDLMANSLQVAELALRYRRLLLATAPEHLDRITLCFTEWEGSWDADNHQIRPGTMMWSLANGILYADALGQMAAALVEVACHYDFQSNNFGLIRGWCQEHGWGGQPWDGQTIRPKALALKLWSQVMRRTLLACEVSGSPTYDKQADWWPDSYAGCVPYVTAWATRDEDTLALMIINRHESRAFPCRLSVAGGNLGREAFVHLLTGPSLSAQNDGAPGTVRIVERHFRLDGGPLAYRAPPASVSVLTTGIAP